MIWNDGALGIPWPLDGVPISIGQGLAASAARGSPRLVRRVKTLLVTGGSGQLARSLVALAPRFATLDYELRHIGRPKFDFDSPDTIDASFVEARPALVVNAAGWTAVDAAELRPEAAARANDSGPARLGARCATADIPYIHISTDYVFDGNKGPLSRDGPAQSDRSLRRDQIGRRK